MVRVAGARAIQTELVALEEDSPGALLAYLRTFGRRGWRKALAFCNTRAEIESYAAAVRAAGSPFGDAVYVHYSNLEQERSANRRFIEMETVGDNGSLATALEQMGCECALASASRIRGTTPSINGECEGTATASRRALLAPWPRARATSASRSASAPDSAN